MTLWVDRVVKPSPTNEPPAPNEQRRNDIAVAVTVLFALFLALGIRNQVYSASKVATLDGNVRIAYPERWVVRGADGSGFTAVSFGSPSTFDSRVEVSSRPLKTDEFLELARFDRGLKLASEVAGYRELEAEEMQVLNGAPAIVATYGFIADPTRDSGVTGLPVVVEAQDIMFVVGDRFYVVSLQADANDWADNARDFAVITNSLRLREARLSAPPAVPTPEPGDFTGDAAQLEGGN